jgi:hypothetical protein
MKKYAVLALIFFTINSMLTFAQEQESILNAPDNWKSELIPFPISFAPSINYIGFEDLRFTPTWSDSTSQEFWTYTFVWYVEKDSSLTESSLSEMMNSYYDGLMGVEFKKKADQSPIEKTLSIFITTKKGFKGKIRVYDSFFTKKEMLLYVKVKEAYCAETNKQLISFEISHKEFKDPVWDLFKDVKLKVKCD